MNLKKKSLELSCVSSLGGVDRGAGSVRAAAALVCLGLTVVAPMAHAQEEESPLFLTLTQEFEHDDNLLRQEVGRVSDVISSTQATVGLDKRYGRQAYTLDATFAANKYKNNSKYNNDSYEAGGTFATEIGSNFRVSLDANAARSLPAFDDSAQNRQVRNIRTNHSVAANLLYGLHGRLSAIGGASQSRYRYEETISENKSSSSGYVGLRYRPHELMYYGLTYTRTQTDFKEREFEYATSPFSMEIRTGEEVKSDNLSLSASWRITGFSLFNGSVGYSKERHTYDKRRDFSGFTGSAGWTYIPTDKTTLRFNWSRDTNNSGSTSYVGLQTVEVPGTGGKTTDYLRNGYVATNRLINSYVASVSYDLTSKVSMTGSYSFVQYDEEQQRVVELVGSASGRTKSRYNGISLGATYQALRSLGFGCSLQFYDRTASQFQTAYDGRTASCKVAFTLQ